MLTATLAVATLYPALYQDYSDMQTASTERAMINDWADTNKGPDFNAQWQGQEFHQIGQSGVNVINQTTQGPVGLPAGE